MAEQDQYDTEFVLHSVGDRLRIAREAAGLSLADIAARTKIAERHLTAIEEDRFDDLASSTYAVGFARAFARTVGLDESDIARQVRSVLEAGEDDVLPAVTFEPGDPARIPTPRLAWFAAAGVIAVVAAIFVFWRSYFTPAVTLPDLTHDEPIAAVASTPPVPAGLPAPLASETGAVALPPAIAATGPAPAAPAAVASPPQQARPAPRPAPTRAAAPAPRPAASSAPASDRPSVPETPPSPAASPEPAAAEAATAADGQPASTVSP